MADSPWGNAALSRRRLLGGAVGLGATGALALTGCSNFTGGSGGAGANGSGQSGTGGASDPNFTFTSWGAASEKTVITNAVTQYAAGVGLTAKCQTIPTNYDTKLNTMVASNNPPDAGYLNGGPAMQFGTQGKILSVLGQPGFDQFVPQAVRRWAPDKAVSMPALECMTLFYDKDAAGTASVQVPSTADAAWSWDAFVQAADALTVDDNGRHPSENGFDAKRVKRYGTAAPTGVLPLLALLKSNGIDLFATDGSKTNIDQPAAAQVMQAVNDLIYVHRVAPSPAQATTIGASTALLLASKRVAMTIDGTWALLDLSQSKVSYDTAVLPKFQTFYTTLVGGSIAAFAGKQHGPEALGLLVDLADVDKVSLYKIGLWMPLLKKYYTDDAAIASWTSEGAHPAGFRTACIDTILTRSVTYPSFELKNFPLIETTMNNGLSALFNKQITDMQGTLSQLAGRVNQQMKGVYAS